MKHNIFLLMGSFAFLIGCSSSPNKAEPVVTTLNQSDTVSGVQQIGVRDGNMVVQDKVQMAEQLRDLQNRVYGLEDQVYGTRKLGSLGQYGDLKSCRRKLASKQYGGAGTLVWTEPLDRVSDREEELKMGLDEKNSLVGVSEEFLKDRVNRFQGYKRILQKRSDEFSDQIETCKVDLATKMMDATQSSKVLVTESPKAGTDREALNKFMCDFVKPGASLENFMVNGFAHGWLSLADFKMDQNLLASSVKDSANEARENAFLFNGWKMAFDTGPITVGELLGASKDAKLVAWAYDRKADIAMGAACLPKEPGRWNH